MTPSPTPRPFALTVFAALLFLGSAAFAETATLPAAPLTQPASTQPSAAAAEFHALITELASPAMEGRGVGTAGITRARDRLVEWFTAAGLRPAFVAEGQPATFLQPFPIEMGVRVARQKFELRVQKAANPGRPGKAETDFNALGFSADGEFAGPLVLMGYGIEAPNRDYDSYRGLGKEALRGKVAVVFRYEPMDAEGHSLWSGRGKGGAAEGRGVWTVNADLTGKARAAARHGAEALLVVDPPRQRGPTLKPTAFSDAPVAAIPVLHVSATWLEDSLTAAGADGKTALAEFQRRADTGDGPLLAGRTGAPATPAPLEGLEAAGEVALVRPRVTAENVVGLLPGAGPLAERFIIVGAHYDHLGAGEVGSNAEPASLPATHPGADDNASGTAAVTMLARRLAAGAGDAAAASSRRSILFVAFSGEERGLLGSRFLASHLKQVGLKPESLDAMVNFDMVGRMQGRKLFVLGSETSDRWRAMVQTANEAAKLSLTWEWKGPGMSDDLSFREISVPTLNFFTGLHADYHRPSDTAEKINATGGAEVVEMARAVIDAAARDPERMKFKRPVE